MAYDVHLPTESLWNQQLGKRVSFASQQGTPGFAFFTVNPVCFLRYSKKNVFFSHAT